MPANQKYLTQSKSQRFAKISASIFGGFLVSSAFHLAIATWVSDKKDVWATFSYTMFITWGVLMLLPFLYKNGWKCWVHYGVLAIAFSIILYFSTVFNSHI